MSESNEENLGLLSLHFQEVFNSKVNIDWEVLNDSCQKSVNNNINSSLSWKEFTIAINKLTLYKAPGLNGISPNAIKVLNDDNKRILFQICSNYFNDDDLDIEEWKIGNLKILPNKGDLSSPNNWRGINLLDMVQNSCL